MKQNKLFVLGFTMFIFVTLFGGLIMIFLMPIQEIRKNIQIFYNGLYLFGIIQGISIGMIITILSATKKKVNT
ncbi:MAG: hypothetical protein AMJ90_06840 [candidate division Zixibacteria bacterium SM23_73_2]|nr:MAG: hypothetical protein AMJ90_06840 [candidate division Zixibacteria bacterium SM23_73_2]